MTQNDFPWLVKGSNFTVMSLLVAMKQAEELSKEFSLEIGTRFDLESIEDIFEFYWTFCFKTSHELINHILNDINT